MPHPAKGQIWRGRDYDGFTEYEVLILDIDEDKKEVHYVVVYEEGPMWTFRTPITFFISIYSPRRNSQCPIPSPRSSQTFWQKLWCFFSELRKLSGSPFRKPPHGR